MTKSVLNEDIIFYRNSLNCINLWIFLYRSYFQIQSFRYREFSLRFSIKKKYKKFEIWRICFLKIFHSRGGF